MNEIYLLLLVPVLSWLDRQRGTTKAQEIITKFPALIGIGYICAIFTGHFTDWQALVITLSIAVLHNFSFGEPLGHALTGKGGQRADDDTTYEVWQVGLLKTNPWLALSVRGAVLGLAGLAVGEITTALKIAIAWSVAFPLAPAIVRFVLKKGGEGWGTNEYIRGAIAGALLWAI